MRYICINMAVTMPSVNNRSLNYFLSRYELYFSHCNPKVSKIVLIYAKREVIFCCEGIKNYSNLKFQKEISVNCQVKGNYMLTPIGHP